MKEMLSITVWQFVLVVVLIALFSFGISSLIAASGRAEAETRVSEEYDAKINKLQQEISTQEELLKHKSTAVLILEQEKSILESHIDSLIADNNKLSDVIARFRDNPNWFKERIVPGNTNWYALEPYTAINNKKSSQYALQQECETGLATGIRTYTDDEGTTYYCAALGSAYGRDLGDTWEVTLDNGESFNIIYADYKDNGKTEFFGHKCLNAYKQPCTCVIEFIVDWAAIPDEVKERGSMSALDWCNGNIIEIKYKGRAWE